MSSIFAGEVTTAAGRRRLAMVVGSVTALAALASCTGDDSGTADCPFGNAVERVRTVLPEVAEGAAGCDQAAVDAMDEILVSRSTDVLVESAERFAVGDITAGGFQGAVSDVSAEQGQLVALVNAAAIDAADTDEAAAAARRAANNRVDDGRGRAGVLAWNAMRAAEMSGGRTDLLTEAQRDLWRAIASDSADAALTPYADLTAEQRHRLRRSNLNTESPVHGNWGDEAEAAFVMGIRR